MGTVEHFKNMQDSHLLYLRFKMSYISVDISDLGEFRSYIDHRQLVDRGCGKMSVISMIYHR